MKHDNDVSSASFSPDGKNIVTTSWDKTAKIYCSKDKRSFEKIPKEYQPLMQRFLGKVIGEFVCDAIFPISCYYSDTNARCVHSKQPYTCLTDKEMIDYLGNGVEGYGWHISDLVIYNTPRELSEFCTVKEIGGYEEFKPIASPPQSWCYVQEWE